MEDYFGAGGTPAAADGDASAVAPVAAENGQQAASSAPAAAANAEDIDMIE